MAEAFGYVTLDEGDETRPPVRVRVITDPDPVLARIVALALALSPARTPATRWPPPSWPTTCWP